MAEALNIIARDFLGFKNAQEVPWTQLRYEHVQIRTKLGERQRFYEKYWGNGGAKARARRDRYC